MAFVRSGQANVWWDSQGEGAPVVLINGLSSPSAVWFRLVPLLSPQHRVITLDNLGTGKTGTPPGPYSMSMLSEAVAAVIGAAGEPAVHVLGISLGGLIAQDLTLNHPELITSLTLVSTHAGIPYASSNPGVIEALTSAASLDAEGRYELLSPFTYAPSTPAERVAEDRAVRAQHPTSEEGYNHQLRGVATWERLRELCKIDKPTLVLHGELDRMVLVEGAHLLAKQIPGARLTVLPDCGHQLFTDQPEMGARTVRDFLDEAARS